MSTTYSVYLPNYSVGPDCYEAIPSVTARYGKKVVIIGGKTALSKAQDAILAAVKGHLLRLCFGTAATLPMKMLIC